MSDAVTGAQEILIVDSIPGSENTRKRKKARVAVEWP